MGNALDDEKQQRILAPARRPVLSQSPQLGRSDTLAVEHKEVG